MRSCLCVVNLYFSNRYSSYSFYPLLTKRGIRKQSDPLIQIAATLTWYTEWSGSPRAVVALRLRGFVCKPVVTAIVKHVSMIDE